MVYLEHPVHGAEEYRLGGRNNTFTHRIDVLMGKAQCKATLSAAVWHDRIYKGI